MVLGPASESIEKLAARGVRFDLAFLDADKGGYLGYYQQARRGACTIPTPTRRLPSRGLWRAAARERSVT